MISKQNLVLIKLVVGILVVSWSLVAHGFSVEAPRITKEEAKKLMNDPNVVIVDVRADKDWASSTEKVKGALREDPTKINSLVSKYPKDKTLILYCA